MRYQITLVSLLLASVANSRARSEVLVPDDQVAWQNPVNALDVNNDLTVTPIDALLVINELNNPTFKKTVGPSVADTRLLTMFLTGKHSLLLSFLFRQNQESERLFGITFEG